MDESSKENSNTSSTPYDDVFRTMINDCTRFVLPLLNEVFGENYDGSVKNKLDSLFFTQKKLFWQMIIISKTCRTVMKTKS